MATVGRLLHEISWNRCETFCSENALEDPTFIAINTAKRTKLFLKLKCFVEGLGFKTVEGSRGRIRYCFSRTLKVDDGWSNATVSGNHCDRNEAKDHVTSIKKDKLK